MDVFDFEGENPNLRGLKNSARLETQESHLSIDIIFPSS